MSVAPLASRLKRLIPLSHSHCPAQSAVVWLPREEGLADGTPWRAGLGALGHCREHLDRGDSLTGWGCGTGLAQCGYLAVGEPGSPESSRPSLVPVPNT